MILEKSNYPKLIITDDFDRVQKLVQSVDLDIQNSVGDTALIRACEGINIIEC